MNKLFDRIPFILAYIAMGVFVAWFASTVIHAIWMTWK
jgi:hypothetical protein